MSALQSTLNISKNALFKTLRKTLGWASQFISSMHHFCMSPPHHSVLSCFCLNLQILILIIIIFKKGCTNISISVHVLMYFLSRYELNIFSFKIHILKPVLIQAFELKIVLGHLGSANTD